ncbi:MAG: hypothetical protein LC624_10875, partial [Halobacteriales archaeon]|nr:hypothetical protein [Halobacteriales archaeon]
PPVITDLVPAPSSHAPGAVRVAATFSDLNLDPTTLVMEVRVQPKDAFAQVEARARPLGETQQALEYHDTFFHGEEVEVRVRGGDAFGRFAERAWNFTVDARVPLTVLTPEGSFLPGNRTSITGNTSLRLDRSDEGSGVLATSFALVNEDLHLETSNVTISGSSPARITLGASPVYVSSGNYTIFYASVDAAGNVEPVNVRKLYVDDSPPEVSLSFQPGRLTARVREVGVGVKEVRATYAIAPGGAQGETLMSPTADPQVWQAQIPDSERGSRVVYSATATDKLGNVGRAGSPGSPLSSVVQNHAPAITLQPPNGSLARGTVRIAWEVADKDGDAVTVRVQARPSTSDQARDLAPERGPSGGLDWDTTQVGDGIWEVVVSARDAFETAKASSFVDVSNTDSKIVRVQEQAGEPGQQAVLQVTLYKPVRQAEAVLKLRGEEVARVPLRDDGGPPDGAARDGVFSGAFFPTKEGDYRMDLNVLFTDGRSETRSDVPVSVQYAYPGRIVHDPLLLGLVIGVPALIVGVFLYRRYGPIRVPGKR